MSLSCFYCSWTLLGWAVSWSRWLPPVGQRQLFPCWLICFLVSCSESLLVTVLSPHLLVMTLRVIVLPSRLIFCLLGWFFCTLGWFSASLFIIPSCLWTRLPPRVFICCNLFVWIILLNLILFEFNLFLLLY